MRTMRRSPMFRIAGLLLGAWFAALSTELPALHECPVHGGAPGAHAHMVAMHHAAGSGDQAPDHHGQHGARCTCFGACCCAQGATLPPGQGEAMVATYSAGYSQPQVSVEVIAPAPPPFVLPPAIGPPAARAQRMI